MTAARWLAVGLFGVAASSARAEDSGGHVVDRVVAVVNGRVITLSELLFEARVAMVQTGGALLAEAELDDAALGRALDHAIAERLEAAEAEKLQAYVLEDGELSAETNAFRAKFDSAAAFERFLERAEVDRAFLESVLARTLRARKVLDGKIRVRAQASDADVRAYFDEHRKALGGASYEQLKGNIRLKLTHERYRRLAQLELRQIRKAADVRLVAPLARRLLDEGRLP